MFEETIAVNIFYTMTMANVLVQIKLHDMVQYALLLAATVLQRNYMYIQLRSFITKTSPCNEDPLTPHFYIVKLGFTGVYIIFLFNVYPLSMF